VVSIRGPSIQSVLITAFAASPAAASDPESTGVTKLNISFPFVCGMGVDRFGGIDARHEPAF
jgi:hypothetical protein